MSEADELFRKVGEAALRAFYAIDNQFLPPSVPIHPDDSLPVGRAALKALMPEGGCGLDCPFYEFECGRCPGLCSLELADRSGRMARPGPDCPMSGA